MQKQSPSIVAGDNFYGQTVGNVVGGRNHNITIGSYASVFDILKPHTVSDAYYNSQKREEEHTSTCHPDTHTRILRKVERWVTSNKHSVCWLRGPAGTGKSTIAHTIAERHQDGRLAGTFFFSRGKGAREDIAKLVPTLAYQIAAKIPSSQMQMQNALHKDPTLLTQSLKRQFLKLIVEPLMNVETPHRFLVVIDGLDECATRDRIVGLIRLLGVTIAAHEYPLQFLLTSRPEPEIHAAFQQHMVDSTLLWLALEDSRDDVRRYLREKLVEVRTSYGSVMAGEPMQWPSNEDLEQLVRKSEGLFIYASTVVQYMFDRRESPQEKLRNVLKVHNGVDPLYTQVITEAQHCKEFDRVIGCIMYLRYPPPIDEVAQLLRLDVSDVRIALDRCHSVLVIPDDNGGTIRPYHASLREFLTNQQRSQDFFLAPAKFHTLIAVACLKGITDNFQVNGKLSKYVSTAWYYHCCLLLRGTNASPDFPSYVEQVSGEVEKVSMKWLRYWIADAFTWTPLGNLRVELPSSKGMRGGDKVLRIKLERIGNVLKDFVTWAKENDYDYDLGYRYHGYRYRYHDDDRILIHVTKFFERRLFLRSNLGWKLLNTIDRITK